mgnify:CR=1 FL=1
MDERVFKKFYDDLGKKRDDVNNSELGETYKRVLEEYKHCLEVEEYIVSFLLIQNLLEDRLYVLFKLVFEFKNKQGGKNFELNLSTYHKKNSLMNVVRDLNEWGVLKPDIFRNLLTSVDIRNKQIHFSFIGIDSFDKELSESYYELFREVDKLIQTFKRKTKLYN